MGKANKLTITIECAKEKVQGWVGIEIKCGVRGCGCRG